MSCITVLHVEDDPNLTDLLEIAFQNLGFKGEILRATSVSAGLTTIQRRKELGQSLDLIIVDMNLSDGRGLEIIREVKSNPAWSNIPVLMLSSETDSETVAEAYTLGANCYLPKNPCGRSILSVIESLYHFWLESAVLSKAPRANSAYETLGRSISYKAQISRIYTHLSKVFRDDINHSEFFLNLALYESNQANLIAFLQQSSSYYGVSEDLLMALGQYAHLKLLCLQSVENQLRDTPHPTIEDAFRWILELEREFNPDILAAGISSFFPNAPSAARAYRKSMASYITDLSTKVLRDSKNSCNRAMAESLRKRALNLIRNPKL